MWPTCGRPSTTIWTNPRKVTCTGASRNSPRAWRTFASAGGIASLAHPVRVQGDVPALMPELCDAGLNAIEAYHSDHTAQDTQLYLDLARHYGLRVTGGSDSSRRRLQARKSGRSEPYTELYERLRGTFHWFLTEIPAGARAGTATSPWYSGLDHRRVLSWLCAPRPAMDVSIPFRKRIFLNIPKRSGLFAGSSAGFPSILG